MTVVGLGVGRTSTNTS